MADELRLMIYNPLDQPVRQTLTIPLYYTGLSRTADLSERDGPAKTFELDRAFSIQLPVNVPARGQTWFAIE